MKCCPLQHLATVCQDTYLSVFAKSADPDEMLPYVAFHLGLLCLPLYPE